MIEELTITLTNAGDDCLEYAISRMITGCEKEEPEKNVCNGGQTTKHMLRKRMETNMILTKLHDDNMYIIYKSEDNVENNLIMYIL